MKHTRIAITLGLIGAFGVFLFGGSSAIMAGLIIGMGLGLSLGKEVHSLSLFKALVYSLLPAAISAAIMSAGGLFYNAEVLPALGKSSKDLELILNYVILGAVILLALAAITTALHSLPERQERIGKLILLAVLVLVFPYLDKVLGLRWTPQIIFALIFTILALGLNIVTGFAGLLDLGYAAFFAIGAYTTGILSSPQHDIQLNFWLVIWIATAVAAVSGLLLGSPTLKLRGDYLAIVTLGFGEIIPVIFRNLVEVTIKEPFTCWILPGIHKLFGSSTAAACITLTERLDLTAGEKGINPIGRPWFPFYGELPTDPNTVHAATSLGDNWLYIGEFQSRNPIPWYFLIIGLILLSIFLIRRLRDGRQGRAWMAIREDELVAAQMGIAPFKTKLLAFAMGAAFSGFAGAFYAAYIRAIFPSVFDFSVSIIILVMVILGGLGNINGVIVGGIIIMTADRLFLPALKDFLKSLLDHTVLPSLAANPTLQSAIAQNGDPILYRFLLFGLTLVIMMAVRPEGLIPSAQRRMELHADDENKSVEDKSASGAQR